MYNCKLAIHVCVFLLLSMDPLTILYNISHLTDDDAHGNVNLACNLVIFPQLAKFNFCQTLSLKYAFHNIYVADRLRTHSNRLHISGYVDRDVQYCND